MTNQIKTYMTYSETCYFAKNENRTNKSKLNFEVKTNSSKKIGILIEKNN